MQPVLEDELELEKSYREMADDLEAEAEALEWIEGTIGDFCDEPSPVVYGGVSSKGGLQPVSTGLQNAA